MAGPLLTAGLTAGANLIGGLFGGSSKASAEKKQFSNQKFLSRLAQEQQVELAGIQNRETNALNDRVDSFNRDILDNHSENYEKHHVKERSSNSSKDNSSTVSTGSIDFDRLVADSEAAGFNPLTVLRAGGLAGYSTSNVTYAANSSSESSSDNTFASKSTVARDLMSYFSPGQIPQGPGVAQAAPVEYGNPWGDALLAGLNSWQNHDPKAQERADLELGIARAQLANLNSDTAANNRRLTVPTWTGSGTTNTGGGFAGAVNSGLGGVPIRQPGQVNVTNPLPYGGTVRPDQSDAAAYEERYGEILANVGGLWNAINDGAQNLNRATNNAGPKATDAATSYLKSAYDAMVNAWNSPAWNAKLQ